MYWVLQTRQGLRVERHGWGTGRFTGQIVIRAVPPSPVESRCFGWPLACIWRAPQPSGKRTLAQPTGITLAHTPPAAILGDMQRGLLVVVLALVVSAISTATATPATDAPPPGLTSAGRTLWQFEALLHDTFGSRPVCSSGRWAQNFTSGACSPLAVYSPYFYVFANAHHSGFHISQRVVGDFGNYPVAVMVRGHPIACDRHETKFLILYRDTHFTLGCLRPGSATR